MSKVINSLVVICMIFFIASVFWYKSKVQISEIELHRLDTDITRAVDNLSVLRAEWSYLNQPERLKERNQNELGLKRKTAAEIHPLESIPQLFPILNDRPAPAAVPVTPPVQAAISAAQSGRAQ